MGCGGEKKPAAQGPIEDGKIVLGDAAPIGGNSSDDAPVAPGSSKGAPSGSWSIFIESASGKDAMMLAGQKAAAIRQLLRRNDIDVRPHPRGAAVVMGAYTGPDDPKAKADLKAVQSVQVDGRAVFANAYLSPPEFVEDTGSLPKYSLEAARKQKGPGLLYTLQIGVYESPKSDEAKRAAEQAVVALRKDGAQAYYFHGRLRSMVTIGIFGKTDFDPQIGTMSPALAALKEKYPDNLYNGRQLLVKGKSQPSALVQVPD